MTEPKKKVKCVGCSGKGSYRTAIYNKGYVCGSVLCKCDSCNGTGRIDPSFNPKYYHGSYPPLCFLTTVTCELLDKPDNCPELEILRSFRDEVLIKSDLGNELLHEYYNIAPKLSNLLQIQKFKHRIAYQIHSKYILSIIDLIQSQQYQKAILRYKEMVAFVAKELGVDLQIREDIGDAPNVRPGKVV